MDSRLSEGRRDEALMAWSAERSGRLMGEGFEPTPSRRPLAVSDASYFLGGLAPLPPEGGLAVTPLAVGT
jgi:hypothetical protein